jgi:acetyl-CoA carboxylase biotin carboxyl carrier protein
MGLLQGEDLTVDYEKIETLVGLLRDSPRLTEMEIRQNGVVLRLRRPPPAGKPRPHPRRGERDGAATNGAPNGTPDIVLEVQPPVVMLFAHFVGVFRPRRPEPVAVGDHVTENQSLGHIEAMRLMNDCPAPISGRVQAVLVQEGQPVEYGQALFEIAPGEPQ